MKVWVLKTTPMLGSTILLTALCLLLTACGEQDQDATACTPGETQACLGPAACEGAQVCFADGSSFSVCDCGITASASVDPSGANTTDPVDPNPVDPNPVDPNPVNPNPDPVDPGNTNPDPDPGNTNPDPDPGNQNPDPDPGNQNPDPGNQNPNPNMCPDPSATAWPADRVTSAGPSPVRVIVESIDFVNNRVVLRNVTSQLIPMDNWGVHLGQGLLTLQFVSGFQIPPDGTFTVHLTESGTNVANASYWAGTTPEFDLTSYGGDISVHNNADDTDTYDTLEAYVRWGSDPPYPDQHHRDEAQMTGLWTDSSGSYVQTSAASEGIVAVGDVTTPAGYATAAPACM